MQRRILLADDHPVVRCGVRSLLEAQTELEFVVTEVETGKEAIEQIMQERPDIAILDYWLPMINGLEVARQVKAGGSKVEIIIFTMLDSDSLADECFRCGARAYLLKSEREHLVCAAIRAAGAHKPLVGGAVVERQLENRPNRDAEYRKPSLTPRELTVLRLLA